MSPVIELKKHVGAVHVAGPLTLLQRKAANVLLYNAYDELPEPSVRGHSIRLVQLAGTLGFNSKNLRVLKETLKTLVKTDVEWNVLDEDGRKEWGATTLLASVSIKDGTGVCRYSYSDDLRRLLHNPDVYARIDLAVQRQFESQYALALYENCVRFRRVDSTGWIPLETWRGLLGVRDGQYARYADLRIRALDPAVDHG